MKILYVATDQTVPGSTGGSVHVEEVARGLAGRGHEVHVFARVEPGPLAHRPRTLFAHRFFRWAAARAVKEIIDRHGVDVVLERYYNFGGEGVRAAARAGVPSVLEVNSPVMDHPGSFKALLDRALLFRPMKRLREEQCRKAAALVTPLPSIVPSTVPREKVFPIHWGANVEHFRPGIVPTGHAARIAIPEGARVVVFSGSFRHWHGASVLVRAAARVLERTNAFFLLIGSGPELPRVREHIASLGIRERVLTVGVVPHSEMPFYLARAHVGVAPFQPSRHGQLQLGFYWSPLKIFEYMAMGLPVVTLDVEPLSDIARHEKEGLLVKEDDVQGLAEALTALVASPERAREMGRAARERVVAHFSWQVHCEKLESVLAGVLATFKSASS